MRPLLALLLLLAASLAGCASDEPPVEDGEEPSDVGDVDDPTPTRPTTTPAPAATPQERFDAAIEELRAPTAPFLAVVRHDEADDDSEVVVRWDEPNHTAVYAQSRPDDPEDAPMVWATVRNAQLVSTSEGDYDGSDEPVGEELSTPNFFTPVHLPVLANVHRYMGAPLQTEDETLEGVDAERQEYRDGTRVWLSKGDGRILRAESVQLGTPVTLTMTYGNLSHPLVDPVLRLAPLVATEEGDAHKSAPTARNWTVAGWGAFPISEARAIVDSRYEEYSFPLAEGSGGDDVSTLAFEDVDGDGAVSPGDAFRWELVGTPPANAIWTYMIEDTTTGLRVRL